MDDQVFYDYLARFEPFQQRSIFGGVGLFIEEAMFVLIIDHRLYLRGGDSLDEELTALNCRKFRQVKKQSIVTVNYYDVTRLIEESEIRLLDLIRCAIQVAVRDKSKQKFPQRMRLRDMPNMQFTIERMVIKAGILSVREFRELGAVEVFHKVKEQYGQGVDINLLWKFAGAIEGVHWTLLREPIKQRLMKESKMRLS